jgi:enoyl-CoA hydratase
MVEITMAWRSKNALGTATMTELLGKLRAAAGAPVLLTGTADAFSAGLDLREVASLDVDGMRTFLRLLESVMVELFQYPGPVVAHVNGHAIAGGCLLALACDHRVAPRASRARIGLNEAALGLIFPPRLLEIVRRRVAPPHLDRVVLGAHLFSPEDAVAAGLIDALADDAAATAGAYLETLAGYPSAPYARNKHALRGASAADLVPDDEAARAMEEALPAWTSGEIKSHIARLLAR